jgi:hypothetical protein
MLTQSILLCPNKALTFQPDFIVGLAVAIHDAFGNSLPKVSGALIPNVDYIVLTHRQQEWAGPKPGNRLSYLKNTK